MWESIYCYNPFNGENIKLTELCTVNIATIQVITEIYNLEVVVDKFEWFSSGSTIFEKWQLLKALERISNSISALLFNY